MSPDPYTEDSAYMRFNLVRLVADSFPKLETVGDSQAFLEMVAKFVSSGNQIPDPPKDEEEEEPTALEKAVIAARQSGAYL
jgi:hypothetical protein